MKKAARWLSSVSLVLFTAGLAGGPVRATAGVYDTSAAWWHFDYDADTDTMADLDEIRDQRDWGTAALKGTGGKHATTIRGFSGGPRWTNSAAFRPAGGQEYGGKSLLFQTAVDPANSNCWPDTFLVSNLGLAGSATLVTRFRWDGYPTEIEKMSWLYNNALEWGTFRGWLFGVQSNAYPRLTLYTQRATLQMDVAVTNGVWYDVALVLTDGNAASITNDTVEFYLYHPTGGLSYRKYTTTVITNSIGTGGTTVGCEASTTGYANGNARKAFIGALNHLAVWNRALTFAEVSEALNSPQPLFQIGLNNNSVADLRPESETDAAYLPGDPWHTMRRAVTATYTDATVKLPLSAAQAKLDTVFHVETSTDGTAAGLSLIVNSTTNAPQTAAPNKDLYWLVTTNMLVTGTNTFSLHYASGPSPYISFDWLELGGSWQVGYEDDSQAEFIIESGAPDDFFVADPNWMHLERAITSGDTNVNVHFALSAEMASKYFFTYTTRITGQGPGGTNHAFSVDFNNTVLKSYTPVPNGTYLTLPLERALVRAGDNVIKVRYDGMIGGYLQFDFHRLEVAEAPKGSLILLR